MLGYNRLKQSIYCRCKTLVKTIARLINTFYEILVCSKECIIINSWVEYRFGQLKQRNWGDELNVYIIESLTKKKVINISDAYVCKKINYSVIGSIIPASINNHAIIWGTGAAHSNKTKLASKPIKVCAVRGKLTRNYLISNGIDCPEVYGDPALLLPLIYTPKRSKKYRLGLICHIDDESNLNYKKFIANHLENDVLPIYLHDYGDWRTVIDKICSCEVIASSSLHGIIVADAYGVPNIWLKSHIHLYGGDFKFLDYFSGVNRIPPEPIILTQDYNLDNLIESAIDYAPINYDSKPLLQACPFKIEI